MVNTCATNVLKPTMRLVKLLNAAKQFFKVVDPTGVRLAAIAGIVLLRVSVLDRLCCLASVATPKSRRYFISHPRFTQLVRVIPTEIK